MANYRIEDNNWKYAAELALREKFRKELQHLLGEDWKGAELAVAYPQLRPIQGLQARTYDIEIAETRKQIGVAGWVQEPQFVSKEGLLLCVFANGDEACACAVGSRQFTIRIGSADGEFYLKESADNIWHVNNEAGESCLCAHIDVLMDERLFECLVAGEKLKFPIGRSESLLDIIRVPMALFGGAKYRKNRHAIYYPGHGLTGEVLMVALLTLKTSIYSGDFE